MGSMAESLRTAARILDDVGDYGVTAGVGLGETRARIVVYCDARERVRSRLTWAAWVAGPVRLSGNTGHLERDLVADVDGAQVVLYGAVSFPLPDQAAVAP